MLKKHNIMQNITVLSKDSPFIPIGWGFLSVDGFSTLMEGGARAGWYSSTRYSVRWLR